jgi:hypothetical protein
MKLETSEARPYVLIQEACFPGGWGRGQSIAEALRNVRANGTSRGTAAGAHVYVCACDNRAFIDEMGGLICTSRGPLYRARVNARSLTLLAEERPAKDAPPGN